MWSSFRRMLPALTVGVANALLFGACPAMRICPVMASFMGLAPQDPLYELKRQHSSVWSKIKEGTIRVFGGMVQAGIGLTCLVGSTFPPAAPFCTVAYVAGVFGVQYIVEKAVKKCYGM
ncbi:uncharacterized protein LOC119767072 [Culex quinquefasciatus]|uniref:uncharacterized protein LOC119767072 n=1 Tax=Culex quinquefasciatus TaxID=7176 RepID=UPI0018E38F14|nr:uncharacterized protein LOC119767072 [Culex quinquefasciatus]